MNVNTQSKNFEMTRAVSGYLNKRIKGINKFANLSHAKTRLDIEIGKISEHHKHGDIFRVELNLHVAGKYYRATAKEADIYSAIDIAQEELLRQLRKNKRRRLQSIRQGGAKIKKMFRDFYSRE